MAGIEQSRNGIQGERGKRMTNREKQQRTGRWIIVEELHGEWEGTKKYACSKCGEKVGVFKSNYCPNCGAKMEAEE